MDLRQNAQCKTNQKKKEEEKQTAIKYHLQMEFHKFRSTA